MQTYKHTFRTWMVLFPCPFISSSLSRVVKPISSDDDEPTMFSCSAPGDWKHTPTIRIYGAQTWRTLRFSPLTFVLRGFFVSDDRSSKRCGVRIPCIFARDTNCLIFLGRVCHFIVASLFRDPQGGRREVLQALDAVSIVGENLAACVWQYFFVAIFKQNRLFLINCCLGKQPNP